MAPEPTFNHTKSLIQVKTEVKVNSNLTALLLPAMHQCVSQVDLSSHTDGREWKTFRTYVK